MSRYACPCLLLLFSGFLNLAARAAPPGPWAKSPVGICYARVGDYLAWRYGASYGENENIGTAALPNVGWKRTGVNYVWASDSSSKNPPAVLLRVDKKGRACAVLESPAGMSVLLEHSVKGLLPGKVVAEETEPHQSAIRITYGYDSKTRTYFPHKCYRTVRATMRVSRVDCNSELNLK